MTLQAEIEQLYEGGAVILPTAANEYVGASNGVHNTSSYDDRGFSRLVPVDTKNYDPTTGKKPTASDPRSAMPSIPGSSSTMTTTPSLGQMQEAYVALRDTFQDRIINQTYKNLVTAGQALVKIAEDYAATDGEAAAALAAEKDKLKDLIPDVKQPPATGDAPPPPK